MNKKAVDKRTKPTSPSCIEVLDEGVAAGARARKQLRTASQLRAASSGHSFSPELLAPAGGFEQLKYAIHFGADAVYVATDRFGLRQRADNFSLEEMLAVVSFAHNADVKVFVACNAYLHDEDTQDLPHYLEALNAAGVDGVIVSDLGVLRLARKHAPDVSIHVSTQAACSNTQAALTWYELGARRIVCAREMSLLEIAAMKREIPADLELEVFVHGAMCMAISGRCLISDYLTGRSANQGHCTQPCRWGYSLEGKQKADIFERTEQIPDNTKQIPEFELEEESRPGRLYPVDEDKFGTYIMSSDDMNMLGHLNDLRKAGIDSLKIEGRNKKAFYVATVVNAYRQVLDGAPIDAFANELEVISHRPYSTGFFYGPASQTTDQKEYIQTGDWVAEVLSCKAAKDISKSTFENVHQKAPRELSDPHVLHESKALHETKVPNDPQALHDLWQVRFACRNRLYEGDALEVLSPGKPIEVVTIEELAREYSDGTQEPVECANQSMEIYSFLCSTPLQKNDMLRSYRKDPTRKN